MLTFEIAAAVVDALAKQREQIAWDVTDAAKDFADMGKAALRTDTRNGFPDGRRMANVWTSDAYPAGRRASLRPSVAFYVRGEFDHVIRAFSEPATLKAAHGNFLIIPTPAALADGLKPDNATQRGSMGRFKKGKVGRNWMAAAERKYGLLKFVPSPKGGGWLVTRNRRRRKDFPIFLVIEQAKLRKRIGYQAVFKRLKREFPGYMARRIGKNR